MTQQTTRSRVLRRVGVAIAAAIAVSTVASTASQAASKQSASKYGGDAKVAIFDTLPGFCFANNPANSSLMVHRTFYETLFEKTIGGDLVGLLAESATPSNALKTWDIKLRSGITFHDGTKLDADALKLNLDYASGHAAATQALTDAAGHATKAQTFYANMLGLGNTGKGVLATLGITDAAASGATATANVQRIALLMALGVFAKDGALDKALGGLGALQTARSTAYLARAIGLGTSAAFIANVTKIEKVDDLTVRLTLDRPQNDVPGMLYASGRFVVRGPSQFTTNAATCSTTRPIGTGPFMAPEGYTLVSTDEIKVVKNPNYWRKDPKTGDKLPYLNSITFTNVKEGSQRAAAVRTGKYDAGQFSAAADGKFIKDLRKRKSLVTEFKSPVEYYPSLWLNQGKATSPFKSKNARLAVLHCLDRVNYNRVRTNGEGTVAKSLVGPKSIMYTTRGFHKYDPTLAKQYLDAWKAEDPAKNTELKFTIPADTSTASQNNAKFLIDTWKKCGITATYNAEEAAQIIAKAFNSGASSLGEQNAYDAIAILLFEGTDVSFNLPFVLKNAWPDEKNGATGSPAANDSKYNSTSSARIYASAIGAVLSLNKHSDFTVSRIFFDGQEKATKVGAATKYQEGTAYLQTEGFMSSIVHFYYSMFINKKNGLTNIGKVQLVKGKTQRIVTNWGIDWAGVQKKG